jgi:hypothetical protein
MALTGTNLFFYGRQAPQRQSRRLDGRKMTFVPILFKHGRIPKSVWMENSKFKLDKGKNMARKWKEAPMDAKIPTVLFPEAFQIIVVGGPANKMFYCPVGGACAAVTKSVDNWR